jgi:hypothetical protein
MNRLLSKKNAIISIKGIAGEYLITIADDDGRTYFIDIVLTKSKFNMRMNSKYLSCFIFGKDLIQSDIDKFNRLVELCQIRENTRKFLNEFDVENYKI